MNHHLPTPGRRRCGFIAMDAAISIALCLTLLLMMTQTVVQQHSAESRLAKVRSDARAAETALLQLSVGQTLPQEFQAEKLQNAAPSGYAWVRVAPRSGASTPNNSLVGLVPAAALEKRGAP